MPRRHRAMLAAGVLGWFLVAVTQVTQVTAQVPLERILKRVNDDIVTSLDVRKARLLRLVDAAPSAGDDEIVQRLVERLLEVAAVRDTTKQPTADQIAERRRAWAARMSGDNIDALLARTGMTEAKLASWFSDDLRVDDYFSKVYGAATVPTRAETLKYYQDHQTDFGGGGTAQDFTAVEPRVRDELTRSRRIALMAAWAQTLVRQADIR